MVITIKYLKLINFQWVLSVIKDRTTVLLISMKRRGPCTDWVARPLYRSGSLRNCLVNKVTENEKWFSLNLLCYHSYIKAKLSYCYISLLRVYISFEIVGKRFFPNTTTWTQVNWKCFYTQQPSFTIQNVW